MSGRPLIGITVDNADPASGEKYQCAVAYAQAVSQAGGLPMMLTQQAEHVDAYVQRCDGLLMTGGDDPVMEPFGIATHPKIKRLNPQRQVFELALLDAAEQADLPLLAICLGMQLMGIRDGATFDQYLPDSLGDASGVHQNNREHPLVFDSCVKHPILPASTGCVVSWHKQALRDAGSLRVIARSDDGIVEAIDDPDRRFCLGVQWHPERIAPDCSPELNRDLFHHLVEASRPRQ